MKRRNFLKMSVAAGIGLALPKRIFAQTPPPPDKNSLPYLLQHKVTAADRAAAAKNARAMGLKPGEAGAGIQPAAVDNSKGPHYFGPYANYANSPMPKGPISSIAVADGGSGYSAAPAVTIGDVYGTGKNAAAAATVVNGVITAINLTNAGSDYSAPVITITDPTGAGALAAAAIGGALTGGIRKFVDALPGLGSANQNNLKQYITVASPDTITYPGCDYYEIELRQYAEQLHSDLPLTTLRGYVQVNNGTDANGQNTIVPDPIHYLGPLIVANKDRPVRVKFTNKLPTGAAGDLFIPVDKTVMGAGMGPLDMPGMPGMKEEYTQNRATVHLHGALVPWISDGTPHQWTTPAGETTQYPKGVSVQYVPDMWFVNGSVVPNTVGQTTPPVAGATNNPGGGSLTFYYNNQQSARLLFYHDHSYGITRLNVYSGEAAGYLITDPVESDLINGTNVTGVNPGLVKVLPDMGIPLILQDKTFVDAATIMAQDPNWKWGSGVLDAITGLRAPNTGDIWVPNVYMPAQNPYDLSGANAYGRWMYGPWFWPPTTNITNGPIPNEYYDPVNAPWEPPMRPDMPNPSMGMEAFNDTPLVNGTAYPYLEVEPRPYRFRILNAANDRFFNLHFYLADPAVTSADGRANTEVKMVPAAPTPGFPATWPVDGRASGVPDPATAGPSWIQIGTEGGFLPEPVVIPPQPINWNMNQTAFNFGNVTDHSLLLGCAERADVIVDFSAYAGQTLILFNDAPAAFPAIDPRYDYYTGDPDQTDTGGAPTTQPGFGPNTRTVMQVRVKAGGQTGAGVDSIAVLNGGSDYQFAPEVVLAGGSGTGASATATCSIDHINVLNPGSGYTQAPAVTISGNGSASATAVLSSDGRVIGIQVTDRGYGYTSAPTITIGDGSGSTAVAALTVTAVTIQSSGSGYGFAPTVSFVGGGGYGAQAAAKLIQPGSVYNVATLKTVWAKNSSINKLGVFEKGQDPIIIPQAAYNSAYEASVPDGVSGYVLLQDFTKTFFNGPLVGLNLLAGGTGYSGAPAVSITGGGGTNATATATITGAYVNAIALTSRGSGYLLPPTVTISGGTGSGAAATATITRIVSAITVTNGGSGYTSAPTVRFTGGGGSGAAATAIVSGGRVTSVIVTSGGAGYTSLPSISFSGGGGRNATAAAILTGVVNGITITNNGSGYATSPLPTVTISGGSGSGAAATASVLPGTVTGLTLTNPGTGYTSAPAVSFSGGGGSGAKAEAVGITIPLEPKAMHDEMGAAYDTTYGRMGGMMGLELPVTNALTQNLVLYGFASPPVDLMQNSMTPLGTLKDGTQIWKITHNGVDTHPVHFHLVNVQLVNRVAWDGALLPPEPNELGWKETVRTNPLEHLIVAMRPVAPVQPFDIPNSVRYIDPTMPPGATLAGGPQGFVDPGGVATTVTNHKVNFGWEYVWHCHILSHEEMDMMHALAFGVAPKAPANLAATYNNTQRAVTLTWTDSAANATGFKVQRAGLASGPWATLTNTVPASTGKGASVTYVDGTVQRNRTYFYRVIALNTIGDTTTYAAPAVGYPTRTIESDPSNPGVSIVTTSTAGPGTPVIFASNFSAGLAGWSGVVGNVQVNQQAGMVAGAPGMAAVIGGNGGAAALGVAALSANDLPAQPAYVYDSTPDHETVYDASFYFNPNSAVSGDEPVDIFVGLDQNSQPVFGVEYIYDASQANPYKLCAWALFDDQEKYTKTVDITNAWHAVEIAWQSGTQASFTLYVDDQAAGTVSGDSAAHLLDEVFLGPSMDLTASSSGAMYFADFTSSKINGVQSKFFSFLPWINK